MQVVFPIVSCRLSYQEVSDRLAIVLRHLQSLEDPLIQQWMASDDVSYSQKLYTSYYNVTERLGQTTRICNTI